MLFNSIPFLAFFPIVFVAYWTLNRRAQNWFLIAASSVFYGWWDWRFLGLLWFTALAAFFAGWGISSAKNNRRRRLWLGVSLSAHLGLLVVFKYLDWGIQSLTEALRSLGFNVHGRTLGLILPIGISFYTFQALSYTIDVYRKKIEATGDLIDFSAFITFFPQLVAGPIERAPHMLPQFREARVFDSARAADGCRQILYGFLLKTVIADNCASVVDAVYGNIAGMSGGSLLLGTYAFALQIYGDFAGYSHIAIGCARLLGFDLNRNFAYPYFSRSPVEFWHRWHISLSTWFRDYVYLSLWRKRSSLIRQRLAVLATFFVSGLWHGASFRFAIWGVAHGLGVAGQWWPSRSRLDQPGGRRLWPRGRDALAMFLTFHWVCLLWVFFRARSVTEALSILGRIGSSLVAPSRATVLGGLPGGISLMVEPLVLGACMLSVEWLQRRKLHPFDIATLPGAARWAVYLAACLAIVALGRREVIPFIYFQF
jgi:D-alanyl-lipoteichoic acid acyltransferase DltB (MBOAT superfamily)